MKKELHFLLKSSCILAALMLCIVPNTDAQYCSTNSLYAQCSSFNMYIQSFSTSGGNTNITNNNTGCGNSSTSYRYYSNLKHAGVQGTTVNYSVRIGSSYPQGVRIWVDFNGDGDFTDGGELVATQSLSAGQTKTGSFTVPLTAKVGNTRMRVRSQYSSSSINPCGSVTYGECEDYVFEVVPNCSAKFTQHPNNGLGCQNGEVIYTVQTTDADSFRWQVNQGSGWSDLSNSALYKGTNTATMTLNTLTASMQSYTYRAIAHNRQEACEVESNPATVTMVPASNSSIIIMPSDTAICKDDEVTIKTAYTNGGSSPAFQWQKNGKDILGQTAATYTSTGLEDGDVIACRFISDGLCVLPSVSGSVVFDVSTTKTAKVGVMVSQQGPNQFVFTALPTNGGPTPKYQWYKNGKLIQGATGSIYVGNDLSKYDRIHVDMQSSYDCVDKAVVSSKRLTTSIGGVEENEQIIALYPNPNNGSFTMKATTTDMIGEQISVEVVNAIGQKVYQQTVQVTSADMQLNISLAQGTPQGIYTLNLRTGNGIQSTRFVIN